MKKVVLFLACALAITACATGCAKSNKKDDGKNLVYAVEAGSAGESVAKEKGYKINAVNSQADALMEVKSGASDAAIIDKLMACAMIGEGTSYENLTYGKELNKEEYGVGCRKGSDLVSYINEFFYETYTDGSLKDTAAKYDIEDTVVEQSECSYEATEDSDVEYIKNKGKLVVGVTEFEPMDYKDEDGNWVGFDADMAKLLAKKLGVEVEFIIIDWDTKAMELSSKNIDVIWNGMTITDEVKGSMDCSNAYCDNAQVVVEKK